MQTKMFMLMAAMLALTAFCEPTSFMETEVDDSATYSAYAYLDTFSDESCLLSGNKIGNGEGLLFEDWSIKNLCIVLDDTKNQLYLVGVESGTNDEIELIQMGTFKYSYRVKYITSTEQVYVQRTESGAKSTTTFSVDAQTAFRAEFLTAYFTYEEDFEEIEDNSSTQKYSVYPYETSWAETFLEEYEVSFTLSQGEASCVTPSGGRLEDVELCVDYTEEGIIELFAEDTFIYRSEDLFTDYTKITVSYSSLDSFVWFESATSGSKGDELDYVAGIDVLYIVNEGVLNEEEDGSLALYVSNIEDQYYDCVTFKHSLLEQSAVYYSLQGMCVICAINAADLYECTIQYLLEDSASTEVQSNFTMSSQIQECPQTVTITLELERDQFNYQFWTIDNKKLVAERFQTFTKYADELVEWAANPDEYIIVNINDEDMILYEERVNYGSGLLDKFQKVVGLQFDKYNEGFGVWCNEYRCMLGFLREMQVMAVKVYEGQYTDWIVTPFGADDDDYEMICFSLTNYFENLCINDCATKDQWMRYQSVIGQYPVWEGIILDTDYDPSATSSQRA